MIDWFKFAFKKFIDFMRIQKGKILTRLIVSFVMIIILSISGIGFISYYLTSRDNEKAIIDASKEVTSQIVENLEFNFQHINTILLIPFYNPDFIDNIGDYGIMDETKRFLFNRRISNWFLKSLYLYTRKDLVGVYIFYDTGDLIYSSTNSGEGVKSEDIKNSQWFKRAVKEDGKIAFLGEGKSLFHSDRKLFFASRLIKNDLNDRYTIMLVEFNTTVFDDICSKVASSNGRMLFITDENGNIVFSKNDGRNLEKLDNGMFNLVKTKENSFWYRSENENYLVTSSTSPTTNWKVISLAPQKMVYENSIKVRNITIFIAILSILVCAFISALLSSKISKPITRLLRTFDKVKKGDYDVRVKITDKYDEISQIGRSFNDMICEIDELIKNKYINQLKLRDAELGYLNSQINPHFLYNTLDCIKSMAEWNELEKIPMMITSLSDMFRYSIKDRKSLVTVEDELNNINRYLTIQSVRFDNKFRIEFSINDSILKSKMPKFIIQPIVENAIFHGIEKKQGKCRLYIHGDLKDHDVIMEVEDDGMGMNEVMLTDLQKRLKENERDIYINSFEKSIGMVNVHTRLILLYGDEYGLSVYSKEGQGTRVIIRLPFINS